VVIEAGLELTMKAGGSFIKLDAGGVTVLGPRILLNAGGSPGEGSGTTLLSPALPVPVDKANTGGVIQAVAQAQEHFDEQIKLVSCTGQPLKFVTVAVYLPSEMKPQILTTDENGLLPRIRTQGAEKAEIYFHWEDIVVPPGADDYLMSRKR